MNIYFLSKLLPLIFSPLGLSLIFLLIFLFKKKYKYIYIVISSLFIFSNGIISDSLSRFLEYPYKRLKIEEVRKADGIVVLSGSGVNLSRLSSEIINWNDPDRFFAGINLYNSGKAEKLIFTGGSDPYSSDLITEGDIYLNQAISTGIPEKNLYSTFPVFNTYQEAKAIKKLLSKYSFDDQKNIILVTSAFHMKRAKRIFEREGINVQPFPVDFTSTDKSYSIFKNPFYWIPSAHNFYKSSSAVREIIGQIIYGSWR